MPPVLSTRERAKRDTRGDETFYEKPQFVTHADEQYLQCLIDTYAAVVSDGHTVFDAMSSWVSHLPPREYDRVVGHGLNEAELEANGALDEWFVQNVNESQQLPLADDTFDAVLCALSVQYLQYPGAVFGEFERVLAPGGVLVVSFTNRMFPTKAVRAWRTATMEERIDLVCRYCEAGGLTVEKTIHEHPGEDPFVAVIAGR